MGRPSLHAPDRTSPSSLVIDTL